MGVAKSGHGSAGVALTDCCREWVWLIVGMAWQHNERSLKLVKLGNEDVTESLTELKCLLNLFVLYYAVY